MTEGRKANIAAMAVAAAVALTGCGSPEPRSKQYFTVHLDEAREIIADCRNGAVRGDECVNADVALIEDKAAKARSHFLGN